MRAILAAQPGEPVTYTYTYTYTRTDTDLCHRCEHPADWHRHDDTSRPGENGHNSHGAILGEQTECPYRCIGYDCTVDGPPPARNPCGCPDYVPEIPPEDTTEGGW